MAYHDGATWTERRRMRPAWTVWAAEFGVTPTDSALDLEGGHRLEHPSAPRQAHRSTTRLSERTWPSPLGLAETRPGRPANKTRVASAWSTRHPPRRASLVLAALAVIGVVLLAAIVGNVRPGGNFASADVAYASEANRVCTASLGPIQTGANTPPAAASDAGRIDALGRRVEALATELEALPGTRGTSGAIGRWLAAWHRFAAEEHQAASQYRSAPGAIAGEPVSPLDAQARADAASSDAFARAHGLQSCTLLTARIPNGLVQVP